MNLKKIGYWIIGKEYKEGYLDFPNEFVLIDFSSVAKQEGIRDDQNKIIYWYSIKYGKRVVEKIRYHPARVKIIKDVYNIPIMDKTNKEEILPIFARSLPSELILR